MRILVEVTKQDIKEGRSGNCQLCPIALAVKTNIGSI